LIDLFECLDAFIHPLILCVKMFQFAEVLQPGPWSSVIVLSDLLSIGF
jgi:hypothetical protein